MKSFLGSFFFCASFLLFGCLAPLNSFAQVTSLESPVTFSVSNQPVAIALDLLSVNTGVTFSYNPDQIDADKRISMQVTGKSLREVLESIFPPDTWNYKLSGTQVILYTIKSPPQEIGEETTDDRINDLPEPIVRTDTIFITRTEVVRDTLIRTDTLVKYDTVIVIRAVQPDTSAIIEDIPGKIHLGNELEKRFSFETGFSLTWLAATSGFSAAAEYSGKLESYREAYSGSLLSGSLNALIRIKYARFSLESGLSYTGFSQKFVYDYMEKEGGYYRKDTLDIYYTLKESDTLWYYVLDSTYLPLDQKDYRYNAGSHYNYIDVPLALQFNQPAGRWLVYAKAGIIASFSTGNNGWYILAENDGIGEIKELDPRAIVISWMAGAGLMIPVSDRLTFTAGVLYRQQLQDIFKDFPVGQRIGAFGINAGICYKIKKK